MQPTWPKASERDAMHETPNPDTAEAIDELESGGDRADSVAEMLEIIADTGD